MSECIQQTECSKRLAERIVATLRVRPETLEELSLILKMNRPDLQECVEALRRDHVVLEIEFEGERYYTLGW
jgi:hypothetical protein